MRKECANDYSKFPVSLLSEDNKETMLTELHSLEIFVKHQKEKHAVLSKIENGLAKVLSTDSFKPGDFTCSELGCNFEP